jgi:hypothetical protein
MNYPARLATIGIAFVSFSTAVAAQDVSSAAVAALSNLTGPSPDQGIPIGGWMFYPSFMSGVVFNDNIYQRQTNRVSGVGIRLRPFLQAESDNGLHKTTAYFMADVQIYPGQGQSTRIVPTPAVDAPPTNATGRAGVVHIWEPMADLTFDFIGDYTRQNGLFGSNYGVGEQRLSLLSTNTVSAAQQYTNQYSAYISAQKNFAGRFFLRGKTGAQYVSYDSRPSDPSWFAALNGANLADRSQDGWNYTGSIRGGMWITPQIYGFVEPGADLRFYGNSWSDTNGYRVTGGLGSDMISLLRGEVYGGFQGQTSAHGYFGTTSSPAFGARIFYYPLPYVTLTASVDQTLSSAATQPTIGRFNAPLWTGVSGSQAGASSKTLQARVQGAYNLSQYWTAYVRGGYGETRWSAPYSLDTVWTGGVGVNYNFWRNISITVEYQFSQTFSTRNLVNYGLVALANLSLIGVPSGYSQNIVSAGLTYRY